MEHPQYAGTVGAPAGEFLRRVVSGEFQIPPGDITD
jgi:hypothetical protein